MRSSSGARVAACWEMRKGRGRHWQRRPPERRSSFALRIDRTARARSLARRPISRRMKSFLRTGRTCQTCLRSASWAQRVRSSMELRAIHLGFFTVCLSMQPTSAGATFARHLLAMAIDLDHHLGGDLFPALPRPSVGPGVGELAAGADDRPALVPEHLMGLEAETRLAGGGGRRSLES